MIITKKDGSVFKTEVAAKLAARTKTLKRRKLLIGEFEVVKSEGGWVIKVSDDLDISPATIPKQTTCGCDKEECETKTPEPVIEKPVKVVKNWTPVKSILEIPEQYKTTGRRYRWVNTSIEGNVHKKQSEGWVIDRDVYRKRGYINKSQTDKDFHDKTQSSGTETRLRELILMWIPKQMADQRNKYYRDKANMRVTQDTDNLKSEFSAGGKLTGELRISRH